MKLKFYSLLFFILILTTLSFGQKTEIDSEKIYDVEFCNLLKNPLEYTGKLIRVKATFQSFFEMQKMFCSDCPQKRGTWVDFSNGWREKTKKIFQNRIDKNPIVNVSFVGMFHTGKTYGHQNGYDSEFLVTYVENVQVVSKKSLKLSKEEKAKTYCQSKS